MRKRVSFCLLMAGFAISAMGQYVDGTAATKASQESFIESKQDWDGVRVAIERNMYIMPDLKIGNKMYDNKCIATSVAVSYLHGFAISKKKPIFLETGFGIKWGMYDIDVDREISEYTNVAREKLSLCTFEVPLNVGYRFDLNNPDWHIFPYTGLYLRLNAFGRIEAEDLDGYKDEANIFDEDEFYPTFERFLCGWQLGCDVQYREFSFGLCYGIDLNKIWIDTRVFTSSLTFGYRF